MIRSTTLILLLISLMVSACGRRQPVLKIDGFEEYVSLFEVRSSEFGRETKVNDLIIEFGDLPNPRERGACEIVGDQTPRIVISRKKWDKLDEVARRQLLFHEMGHCVLFRDHRGGHTEDGIPVSLMNPYAIDSYTYAQFEEAYNQELFTHQLAL